MSIIKQSKIDIPEDYQFLLKKRLHNTSEMKNKYRIDKFNRAEFNKCERCHYNLLNPSSYKSDSYSNKYPHKGFVHYYDKYKLILCDCCIDYLNGHPWER